MQINDIIKVIIDNDWFKIKKVKIIKLTILERMNPLFWSDSYPSKRLSLL